MKIKFILPALTEAESPFWRPIKYSLFPPLGLATLAAYLDDHLPGHQRFAGSLFHGTTKHKLKHFFYAGGWKKFEPVWNAAIQMRRLVLMTPLLEAILSKASRTGPEEDRTSTCSSASLANSGD